jgi:hypothetical protein
MSIRPQRSVVWGGALVVLAVAQAVAPSLPSITGVGVPIGGDRSGVPDPPLVPLGYAFSIWGPVFLGCLLMALMYCTRAWRVDRALHALAPWFGAAMAACTLWSVVASYVELVLGQGWWGLTIPNFLLILVPLAMGLASWTRELARMGGARASRGAWLVGCTLGLYAGWCTAAIFANVAAWLASPPMLNFGWNEGVISLVLVVCAGAVAHAALWKAAGAWCANACIALTCAVVWALVAIGLKNIGAQPEAERVLGVVAFVLAASLAAALIVWLRAGAAMGGRTRRFSESPWLRAS